MDNWYYLYKMAKVQQREDEIRAMNQALLAAGKKRRKRFLRAWGRKAINRFGRMLETLGRDLQKNFKHAN